MRSDGAALRVAGMVAAFLPLLILFAVMLGLLLLAGPLGLGPAQAAPDGLSALLAETLWLAGYALLVAVPISGWLAAYLYALATPRTRTRVLALARLTAELPPLLVAVVVYAGLSGDLTPGAEGFTADAGHPGPHAARLLAGVTLGLWLVPATTLAGRDALARVPRRLYRSAVVLGAAPVDALRLVVLPAAAPRLAAVGLAALARCLAEGLIVGLVGGGLLDIAADAGAHGARPGSLATALLEGRPGWAATALLLAVLQVGLHRSSRLLIERARREAEP